MIRALLAAACVVVLTVPATAAASRSQITLFEAPREIKSADAGVRAQTFDEIQDLGAQWIRVLMYWHDVAPHADAGRAPAFDESEPDAYPGWAPYDRAIREARERGMQVLLTVSGPVPRWATRDRRDTVSRPSPARFRRFMTAVGRRYAADVDTWSIWNEPQHPQFLGPQFAPRGRRPVSPTIYRALFRAGRRALDDTGNGDDTVLMGETSPRGSGRVMAPLKFLRATLCLTESWRRRRDCTPPSGVDGWATHPYTTRIGPRFVPREPSDVTIGTLSRLTRALDRAARAGVVPRRLPIWLTEFGVQSAPDPISGVSELRQAEYRSISERIAWRNPRVRAFSQYLMRDDLPREGPRIKRFRGFESGLRHSGGEAKIAFEGFRLPLTALRSGEGCRRRPQTAKPSPGGRRRRAPRSCSVSLWGLVRPARGVTTVTIERRDGGGSWEPLMDVETDASGYWTAMTARRSGRSYRAVWTADDGRTHTGPRTRVFER